MSVHLKDEHIARARELVAEARSRDGLAPIDIEQFWNALHLVDHHTLLAWLLFQKSDKPLRRRGEESKRLWI